MLSRPAEIALLVLPLLPPDGPREPGRLVRSLAEESGLSRAYLAKVLQQLADRGLLRSRKGRTGGFVLGRPAREITLADVVVALSGKDGLESVYRRPPGAAGERLEPARRKLMQALSESTIEDLAAR